MFKGLPHDFIVLPKLMSSGLDQLRFASLWREESPGSTGPPDA